MMKNNVVLILFCLAVAAWQINSSNADILPVNTAAAPSNTNDPPQSAPDATVSSVTNEKFGPQPTVNTTAAPTQTTTITTPTTTPTTVTTTPVPANTTTPVPANTTTPVPANTTTPVPANTTTPVPANTTTTVPSNTTVSPTTPTTVPTSNGTMPTSQPTTVKPTAVPSTSDRRFDGPSFIGGIVLSFGIMAIGFVAWKFYKARTERNYHTL